MSAEGSIDIFLSHSSRDSELAKALAELFCRAFTLPAKRIRCTSVSGFKLDVGVDTNEQLRTETVEACAFVGLITELSIDSAYVLFELGARWGAKKFLAPLLGAGQGTEILAGPLSGLNALACTREDLFQLIGNVGAVLDREAERPDVYSELVDNVVTVSAELAAQRGRDAVQGDEKSGTPRSGKNTESLTDFQCEYLMTMSRPRNDGFIYGGIDEEKGREAAPYQEAMERFQALTLVSYGGGGYKLTPTGWKLVDQLWDLKILDTLSYDEIDVDDDIATKAELTDGEPELNELHRHLSALEDRGFVRVTKSSGGWMIQITEAGATHRKHRPLSL